MTENGTFIYLPDQTLHDLQISTSEILDSLESAILNEAHGALWTAPKSYLLPGDGRYMMTTLAASDDPGLTVVKSVMVSPRNPGRGLNGTEGTISIYDSETGLLRAVMSANWVTAVRTAGLSAVVARRLADPDSRRVAFIGCGVQARSHLEAFQDLFPLAEVRAYGRGRANIERLCSLARERGLEAQACQSAREALDGADLIVTSVTLSFDLAPFLDARWLKPGAFATITDLAIPWIPDGMAAFETVVIDDHDQENASKDKMVSPDLVKADLKGLITGREAVTFAHNRRGAFIFRGLALGDFAVSSVAYARASQSGWGTVIQR